jgi:hypothetical protein
VRSFLTKVEQLSALAFLLGAAVMIGAVRAAWGIAGVRGNAGAAELLAILRWIVMLAFLAAVVHRRRVDSWTSAIHLVLGVLAGELVAVVLMLPFLPNSRGFASQLIGAGIGVSIIVAVLAVPGLAALIWFARRLPQRDGDDIVS